MMPIKVTTKLFLKDMPERISKRFTNELKGEIKELITDSIQQGLSPVGKGGGSGKGKGRYKQYSVNYAKWKGVPREAVDMTLTGQMLKSLRVKQNKIGQVIIFFSRSKPALYHDRLGAGRGKVLRRLLPSRKGETFTQSINKTIFNILLKAVRRETS